MATDPNDIINSIDAAILAIQNGGGAQRVRTADGREIEYMDSASLLALKTRYEKEADATKPNTLRFSPVRFGDTM